VCVLLAFPDRRFSMHGIWRWGIGDISGDDDLFVVWDGVWGVEDIDAQLEKGIGR